MPGEFNCHDGLKVKFFFFFHFIVTWHVLDVAEELRDFYHETLHRLAQETTLPVDEDGDNEGDDDTTSSSDRSNEEGEETEEEEEEDVAEFQDSGVWRLA